MGAGAVFASLVGTLVSYFDSAQAQDEAADQAKKASAEAKARQDAFIKAFAPSDTASDVPVMPTAPTPTGPDAGAAQAAARRQIAASIARRGRASTILTSPNETLGA